MVIVFWLLIAVLLLLGAWGTIRICSKSYPNYRVTLGLVSIFLVVLVLNVLVWWQIASSNRQMLRGVADEVIVNFVEDNNISGKLPAKIEIDEWRHGIFPRATFRVVSRGDQKKQLLGMADVAVLHFEHLGMLVHRLSHELSPALAKATEQNRRVVQLVGFENQRDLGLAFALRIDAEPHFCGEGIAGRLHHVPWRFTPAEKAFSDYEKKRFKNAIIVIERKESDRFEIQLDKRVIDIPIHKESTNIEAAEQVIEVLNKALGKIDSKWNRGTALNREKAKALWASEHGLAIEAALAADRTIALGDQTAEVAEWQLRSYSLAAVPTWRDIYWHTGVTKSGSNTSAFPEKVVECRDFVQPPSPPSGPKVNALDSANVMEAAIHAVGLIPDYLDRISEFDIDEERLRDIIQPLAVSAQTMLSGTRVLRAHRGQEVDSPRAEILQKKLRDAFEKCLEKSDRSKSSSFCFEVISRCLPWWYSTNETKLAAYESLFAAADNIHLSRKYSISINTINQGDDQRYWGMFERNKHTLNLKEDIPEAYRPPQPQVVQPFGEDPSSYEAEWKDFLYRRANQTNLDFNSRATAWALLGSDKQDAKEVKAFIWENRNQWLDREDVPFSLLLIWQSSQQVAWDIDRLGPLIETPRNWLTWSLLYKSLNPKIARLRFEIGLQT